MNFSVALSIMFEINRCKQNATDLAEEFEISKRTVYRYIDALCGAGVPIFSTTGKYGGFEMSKYFKIQNYFFTKGEKEYLLNLLKNQDEEEAKYLFHKINSIGTF